MTDIRNLFKESYQQECLPESRLNAILADTEVLKRGFYRRLSLYTSFTAATVAMLVFSFQLYRRNTITNNVIREIATNHTSNLALEVKADNYKELSHKMIKVGFPIKPTDEPVDHFYTLRGGRYSTIGGELAAQVNLRNKIRKQNHTLYAVKLNHNLNAVKSDSYEKNGVGVRVWKNNDMLYAIARTVSR